MEERFEKKISRPMNDLATSRLVIIGTWPGASGKSELPLYPLPPGSTGHRIFEMTGISNTRAYLSLIFRANLLSYNPGPDWPVREASIAADAMLPFLRDRSVVLLGRRVGRAFGIGTIPFLKWHKHRVGFTVAILPHPSARNEWYQSEKNSALAQLFFRESWPE